jgi:hypothetical protein
LYEIETHGIIDLYRLSGNIKPLTTPRTDFKTLSIVDWSIDDVASWLEDWNLEDCIRTFREEKICGKALSLLDKEDLEYLGVIKLGDRIRMYKEIQSRIKDFDNVEIKSNEYDDN